LYYAIYGDTIYHHGAGFRTGELSPVHRAGAPRPSRLSGTPVLGSAARVIGRRQWRRWERELERQHLRQSESIYEKIQAGGTSWLTEFM
jgi:hypothetical protein